MDEEDFVRLYKKNHLSQTKLMSRILNGDWAAAEDVVQSGYLNVWRFRDAYDPELGELEPWVMGVLFNALRHYRRYERGDVSLTDESGSEHQIEIPEEYLSPERKKFLIEEISRVDNNVHRRVLKLFFVNGYTSSEISQIEWVTPTNVTTIVNRFKKTLT